MDLRATLALALALAAACVSVQVDADGATRVRALGSVKIETRRCEPEAPALGAPARFAGAAAPVEPAGLIALSGERTCVHVEGASLSRIAGGVIGGVLGAVFGLP